MNGKICLITGATDGIGKETAIGLAKLGATIVVVGRNEAKTNAVVDDIKRISENSNIYFLIGDLSSQKQVRAVAHQFKEQFQRLDVLDRLAHSSHQIVIKGQSYRKKFAPKSEEV